MLSQQNDITYVQIWALQPLVNGPEVFKQKSFLSLMNASGKLAQNFTKKCHFKMWFHETLKDQKSFINLDVNLLH